ncbi:MAG: SHOCT domain-containing protein [Cyanobacteriota bacterium]|nr:SHOCT domain-containing protein [Cyanobacteriota bacterium]
MTDDRDPQRKVKETWAWVALVGVLVPGLQWLLYLGHFHPQQRKWGWIYLGIGFCFLLPIGALKYLSLLPRLACLLEGLWLLSMSNEEFDSRFNREHSGLEWTSVIGRAALDPEQQLEAMKRSGLITEAEYQQRRQELRKIT